MNNRFMNGLKMLMRKFNAFIEKTGMDKVAHFCAGGMIVALFACYGTGIVGFFVNVGVMWLREYLSDAPDEKDMAYGILGGLCAFVLTFLS
ncbi:MAG: hypothetical protein J6B82_08290 [Bacteroidaceae bacterium]|nr:hypothetical protein [Bacteroidaceae bacterium]